MPRWPRKRPSKRPIETIAATTSSFKNDAPLDEISSARSRRCAERRALTRPPSAVRGAWFALSVMMPGSYARASTRRRVEETTRRFDDSPCTAHRAQRAFDRVAMSFARIKARRQGDLLRRDETGNERKIQAHRTQNSIAEESSMDIRVDSGGTCILRLDRSGRQRRWKIRSESAGVGDGH